jgi:hypothetical protein
MRLVLRIDASALRRWHLDLLERLDAATGHATVVELSEKNAASRPIQGGLDRCGAFATIDRSAITARLDRVAAAPDLMLDLGSRQRQAGGMRHWHLLVDGRAGDGALAAAALANRPPVVELMEGDRVVAAGRLGTEHGGHPQAMLTDVLARLVTLILAALNGGSPRLPILPDAPPLRHAPVLSSPGPIGVRARQWAGRALAGVYRRLFHAPHWRVGWRKLDGPDLMALRRHPASGWRTLPDDGSRFYADPFPLLHRGRLTLFVEDFPHATGKGVISAVAFGPDGPLGTPEPVLEQDGHLSYPFVFERDGEVWMIPESCSAGRVDLYRATAFPGGWVREATLIEDIVASDATIVEHDGQWWMFATVQDHGGAYSDALCLWSAPDFRGPWTAHPHNPVLIDIASARPAGRMVTRDGTLLRPVQDCRRGYGKALGIARVTRLDPEGFEQEVETILTPGPLWRGRRLHSLNSAGGFEFIDGSSQAPKRPF